MPDSREEEVFAKLALVNDPELDQPVTDLGFISHVSVSLRTVRVAFRLPTYWCSPNFAFLMASDIQQCVRELPWVSDVVVSLEDHCASTEINNGLANGSSFCEAFPGMATGELNELRSIFRAKAFLSRQEVVLRELLREGLNAQECLNVTVSALRTRGMETHSDSIQRYLAIRSEVPCPSDTAFVHFTGEGIAPDEFTPHLREARRSRISMEFNASHCRGLLEARYNDQPHLIHIKGTVQ